MTNTLAPHYRSEHTFVSADGGHDLIAKVCHNDLIVVKQGEGMVVLSPEDIANLSALVNRGLRHD